MKYALLVVMVGTIWLLAEERKDQYGVMVFDKGCIKSLTIGPDTRVEFPMINGEPDWKHGNLLKPVINLNRSCGHYEIRRK